MFGKRLDEISVDSARTRLDVGKMTDFQKTFVEESQSRISNLQESFEKADSFIKDVGEKSEKEFRAINENLSEKKREIVSKALPPPSRRSTAEQ